MIWCSPESINRTGGNRTAVYMGDTSAFLLTSLPLQRCVILTVVPFMQMLAVPGRCSSVHTHTHTHACQVWQQLASTTTCYIEAGCCFWLRHWPAVAALPRHLQTSWAAASVTKRVFRAVHGSALLWGCSQQKPRQHRQLTEHRARRGMAWPPHWRSQASHNNYMEWKE